MSQGLRGSLASIGCEKSSALSVNISEEVWRRLQEIAQSTNITVDRDK